MIWNPLHMTWLPKSQLSFLKNVSDQFKVDVITHHNDVIPINFVVGTESWVKAIRITHIGSNKEFYCDIDKRLILLPDGVYGFIQTYSMSNQPSRPKLEAIQEAALKNTAKQLGIDNNIDSLPRQMTFHLNDYGPTERKAMIAYLSSVDSSSVDVVISMNFSNCTVEQLQSNDDYLMMAEIIKQ